MGPKKSKKSAANGDEKTGEKLSELDKEKYLIQIRALGNINKSYQIIYDTKKEQIAWIKILIIKEDTNAS